MKQQPSPIPMTPLSSPCVEKHTDHSYTTESTPASAVSQVDTSLVVTIVTSEEVPDAKNSGATVTVDRELKLRLTLPSNYDMRRLKSFNVTLQQDNSHWQEQQARLFQEQHRQQEATPAPDVIPSISSFDESTPLPEMVPSSSPSNEKRRRRSINSATPSSTAQPSSRKKRKMTNKKDKTLAQ